MSDTKKTFEAIGKYTTFPCKVRLGSYPKNWTGFPANYEVTAETEFGVKRFRLVVSSTNQDLRGQKLFPSMFTFRLGHDSTPVEFFRIKLAGEPNEKELMTLGQALDNAVLTFPGVEVVEDDPEPESVDSKLAKIAGNYLEKKQGITEGVIHIDRSPITNSDGPFEMGGDYDITFYLIDRNKYKFDLIKWGPKPKDPHERRETKVVKKGKFTRENALSAIKDAVRADGGEPAVKKISWTNVEKYTVYPWLAELDAKYEGFLPRDTSKEFEKNLKKREDLIKIATKFVKSLVKDKKTQDALIEGLREILILGKAPAK
jgi:hypothetical protein